MSETILRTSANMLTVMRFSAVLQEKPIAGPFVRFGRKAPRDPYVLRFWGLPVQPGRRSLVFTNARLLARPDRARNFLADTYRYRLLRALTKVGMSDEVKSAFRDAVMGPGAVVVDGDIRPGSVRLDDMRVALNHSTAALLFAILANYSNIRKGIVEIYQDVGSAADVLEDAFDMTIMGISNIPLEPEDLIADFEALCREEEEAERIYRSMLAAPHSRLPGAEDENREPPIVQTRG